MLLIGNTIRLSIFARRREVEVMKLVGATNWFVRWPFMLEGMICGVVGVGAAIVLFVSYRALRGRFETNSSPATAVASARSPSGCSRSCSSRASGSAPPAPA